MINPLIQMKECLERAKAHGCVIIHTPTGCPSCESNAALIALESSGWNLEAIPELIEAADYYVRYTNDITEEALLDAAAKLKGGRKK